MHVFFIFFQYQFASIFAKATANKFIFIVFLVIYSVSKSSQTLLNTSGLQEFTCMLRLISFHPISLPDNSVFHIICNFNTNCTILPYFSHQSIIFVLNSYKIFILRNPAHFISEIFHGFIITKKFFRFENNARIPSVMLLIRTFLKPHRKAAVVDIVI